MDLAHLAEALPKVELHCHLLGAIDLDTATNLAATGGRGITKDMVEHVYGIHHLDRDDRETAFYRGLDLMAELVTTPDDLRTAVYGAVAHGVRTSNLRYLELMVNPTAFVKGGMDFTAMQDGLIAGAMDAEIDFGVRTNFIAAIMRDEPVSSAHEMVDRLIADRREQFVGIGLDGPETLESHRAVHFVEPFLTAERAGLRRTAHYCYFGPAEYEVYLDQMHCERIDHGYPVLDDEAVLRRAVDSGIPYTVCPSITQVMAPHDLTQYHQGSTHPIVDMQRSGVWVIPGTDDGALIDATLAQEHLTLGEWFGWTEAEFVAGCLDSIAATWLDPTDQAALRQTFEQEIATITTPTLLH